jgi:urease accessory protein
MITPAHPDLELMLLADARLPVAGHTQSGSLEGALAHGLTAAEIPAYVRTRLATVVRVEAGAAVVARRQTLDGAGAPDALGAPGSAERLLDVDRSWAARTPSAALRDASRGQGRAMLRVAGRIWPDGAGVAAARAVPRAARPVVLGAVAADVGIGPAALARLVGYDDVQTVCSAALKLAPLDPADVAGWVHDALPEIGRLATELADLRSPDEIPAVGCPQIELWAQHHALSTRRLFRV